MKKLYIDIHNGGGEAFNTFSIMEAFRRHCSDPNGMKIMCGHILAQAIKYPSMNAELMVVVDKENKNKINISEDGGKTFVISIWEGIPYPLRDEDVPTIFLNKKSLLYQ